MRSAYTAQMVDFVELIPRKVAIGDDGSLRTSGVAKSLYSDGTEVVANFNDRPYKYENTIIPARGYIIERMQPLK